MSLWARVANFSSRHVFGSCPWCRRRAKSELFTHAVANTQKLFDGTLSALSTLISACRPNLIMTGWRVIHAAGSRWLLDLVQHPITLFSTSLQHKETIWYFNTKESFIALTIDDAPGFDEETGMEVLSILRESKVKVTFFIISNYVEKYSQQSVLQQMSNDGHELGNHMVADFPYSSVEPSVFENDLLECEKTIESFTPGYSTRDLKWFRPPSGRQTTSMKTILHRHSYHCAMADVFPLDTLTQGYPQFMSDFCLRQAKPGSIICLHFPSSTFRRSNLTTLRLVVPELARRFRCLTLSDALTCCRGSSAVQQN